MLVTGKPICPCDQNVAIFTNDCKKNLHHACRKSIPKDKNSAKALHITNQWSIEMQLSLLKKMFQWLKRIGGEAISLSKILKEFEHMETSQAFPFGTKHFFSFLTKKLISLLIHGINQFTSLNLHTSYFRFLNCTIFPCTTNFYMGQFAQTQNQLVRALEWLLTVTSA